MTEPVAYKIMTAAEVEAMCRDAVFHGSPADLADGFIHMSTAAQCSGTIAKHYAGQTGLRLVAVELDKLGDALRWEPSRGGELFPHLYAPLPLEAVQSCTPLILAVD